MAEHRDSFAFEVTRGDGAVRVILPRRGIREGELAVMGVILLGAAAFLGWFGGKMFPWIDEQMEWLLGRQGAGFTKEQCQWLAWGFAGLLLAKFLFDWGRLLVRGRERVEISEGRVTRIVPIAGVLRKQWRRVEDVRQVRLVPARMDHGAGLLRYHHAWSNQMRALESPWTLAIRTGENDTLYVGTGQPVRLLGELAELLQSELQPRREAALDREARVGIATLFGETLNVPAAVRVVRGKRLQPPMSEVVCEESAEGLVLRVPARGYRGVARHLAVVGVASWAAGMVVFLPMIVRLLPRWRHPIYGVLVLTFVIWDVGGVLLAVWGWQMARRTAVISARREALMFEWRGPWRTRGHVWKRAELGKIGSSTGWGPWAGVLRQLRIVGSDGKGRGLLWGSAAEVEWMVEVLRAFYESVG